MIVRPDKRHTAVFDLLIEFKIVGLNDDGITGDRARKLSETDVYGIRAIQRELRSGEEQVQEYSKKLEGRYSLLRLEKFVVVSLGFERICWKRITYNQ